MTTRFRSEYADRPRGSASSSTGSTGSGETRLVASREITDNVASGDNHSLLVEKWETNDGSRIDYHSGSTHYTDYMSTWAASNSQRYTHISLFGVPNDSHFAAQAVARTNPSNPYVDVPVNILELADVIRTFQVTGRNLITKAAEHNLRFNFGIKPIVTDLVKLTDFQAQVEKRLKMIRKLADRKYRKTVKLGTWSETFTVNRSVETQYKIVRVDILKQTKLDVKGHVRWKPGMDFQTLSQPEMSELARKAVLGLEASASTLWEAFPFSWLADWFSNCGALLAANRNVIPVYLDAVRVMRHTRTETSHPATTYLGAEITAFKCISETKRRDTALLIPSAHIPFLTGNQLGILSSLGALKAK